MTGLLGSSHVRGTRSMAACFLHFAPKDTQDINSCLQFAFTQSKVIDMASLMLPEAIAKACILSQPHKIPEMLTMTIDLSSRCITSS